MRVLTRIRARLHGEQSGFTLVELLIASSIGLIILGSATFITTGAARHNGEVANRTDATQRGRLALERMERLVRSQVCVTLSTYPVAQAKTDSMTFFADLSDGTQPVYQHTLAFDVTNRQITDASIKGSTATPTTFTASPVTNVLATDTEASGTNPFFRYYAYPPTAPAVGVLQPDVELVPPLGGSLSAAELQKVARIDIDFMATGATRSTSKIKAEMTDEVFVRIADPNRAKSFDPTCS